MDSGRTIIIPAAGLGQRVGQPEAKEMLVRPKGVHCAGLPMIAYALEVGKNLRIKSHIVLRKKKASLRDYLMSFSREMVSFQNVEMTREWPDSLLRTEPYWSECNVVCMPDSDFAPQAVVGDMFSALEGGADVVFACFTSADYRQWGVVDPVARRLCEKPNEWPPSAQAWGLFGFRKNFGQELLSQLLVSSLEHSWRPVAGRLQVLSLDFYTDLTR